MPEWWLYSGAATALGQRNTGGGSGGGGGGSPTPALGRAATLRLSSPPRPLTPAAAGSEAGERWVREAAARRHRLATLLARIDMVQ